MKDEWGKSFEQGDIFRSEVAYRHCGRDATWTGPEMMGVWVEITYTGIITRCQGAL